MPDADLRTVDLYEADFAAWCDHQAALARAGRASDLDLANIAEELEGLSRSQRRQIRNRLRVLLVHLLKWAHQPEARSGRWTAAIIEQQRRIASVIEDSPSLDHYPEDVLGRAYAEARQDAAAETGLPIETFPATCPFLPSQVLDPGWLPPS